MTTVHNSSVNSAHHAKKPEKSGRSGTHGAAADGFANAFGDMFSAMVEGAGRQDLAAAAAAQGKASPVGLASEILGPAVHIITTTAPVTSDDSLKAFARAQGMDENALSLIFGSPVGADGSDTGAGIGTGLPGSGLALGGDAAGRSGLGWSGLGTGVAPGLNQGAPGAIDPAQLNAGANATTPGSGSVELGPDASLRWTLGEGQGQGQSTGSGDTAAAQVLFGLNGVRNALSAAQASTAHAAQAASAEPAASAESAHQTLAASLILGAAEASQFARRLQMKQLTSAKADKIDARLGPAGTATAGSSAKDLSALSDLAEAGSVATDALLLDSSLTDADAQLLWQHRQGEGKMSSGQADGAGGSAASAPRSDIDLRAEQYERISARLAESLGQRLAAQIAKGDWKVEMALHPSELGNIDIELQMNKGQLEASFSASQPLTQALIADGLPRLKEMLAQMGMEVASMQVNVRQQGQNGGNPTPRREPAGVAGVSGKRGDNGSTDGTSAPAPRSGGITNDGLDILA